MILDLASTNPESWEQDKDPHFGNSITDAVIYELHVRDLSMNKHSGIQNKGKFLGLLPAVASVIVFLLTEDMRNPMTLADKWTILMLVLLAGNLVLALVTRNRKPEKEGAHAV